MRSALPLLLLLAAAEVLGQPEKAPASVARTRVDVGEGAGAWVSAEESEPQLELAGHLGFSALVYLWDREVWATLPRDRTLKSGPATVGLADPLQVVVLFNAWHLPAARGANDIRLADLRQRVLHDTLTFVAQWPPYELPGFVVLVQKRDREWALVANLGKHYLVEDRSGIGVVAPAGP